MNGSHRRRNLLTGDWVLVSPQRLQRPWLGLAEDPVPTPETVTDCTLCPGATRASGAVNPQYGGPYVFDNDFPALSGTAETGSDSEFFASAPATGTCRVLCYGPNHNGSLAQFSQAELEAVVTTWQSQESELFAHHRYVQIFENRGEQMGASNPHPHGQVWATDYVPTLVERERHGAGKLLAYACEELRLGERVVIATADWLVVVPYWAAWPFETLVVPLTPTHRLAQVSPAGLATVLSQLIAGYDRLFGCPFPYSMGWHPAPEPDADWQLHAHFYPPLLRSASVRKHMVGFELLAETQRDLTPEAAAQRLREVL